MVFGCCFPSKRAILDSKAEDDPPPPFTPQPISRVTTNADRRLSASVKRLEDLVPLQYKARVAKCPFPDLQGTETVDAKASQLEQGIEALLDSLELQRNSRTRGEIVKDVMKGWFHASYPFATVFVSTLRDAASVPSLVVSLILVVAVWSIRNRLHRTNKTDGCYR